MRLPFFGLLFLVLPSVGAAQDICDELWFTRNLVFDRAGYCFGSALGRAVFDNAGCTTNTPTTDAAGQRIVDLVQGYETEWACKVDTTRTVLDVPALDRRRAMIDIPVPTGYESACIGWRGGAILLRSGRDKSAPVMGSIQTGDDIIWRYEAVDGWEFVQAGFGFDVIGWTPEITATENSCDANAG